MKTAAQWRTCGPSNGRSRRSSYLAPEIATVQECGLDVSRYLVSFIRASYGKSFLGPWAEAKPASSPVSWHYAIITDGKQRRQQRDM